MKTKAPDEPRRRAREHLKKILRSTALTGATLGLGSACESCQPVVCDPLPPPFVCAEHPRTRDFIAAGRLGTHASWRKSGGALAVEIELALYASPGSSDRIAFRSDPTLSGARLAAVKRADSTLTFSAIPKRGVTRVEVVIQVDCASKPIVLRLGLDVAHPVVDGAVDIGSLE
jgi:hypothetical protein